MIRAVIFAVFLCGTIGVCAKTAQTSPAVPDAAAALTVGESAIGRTLPDLNFASSDGTTVRLSDFHGKPLLVNMVYTACTDICPAVIEHLGPALEVAQNALGADSFTTITVGFDAANDTPQRMRAFARQHGADLQGWYFLSGDRNTISRLADAVGFTYYPSAAGFEHLALVSLIDAEGRLYRQIYGGVFEPPAIVEPLKDLVFGRSRPLVNLDGLIDRIKLFCTVYNPNTGRYYFDYSMFIGIAIGIACLGGVAGFLIHEWQRSKAVS